MQRGLVIIVRLAFRETLAAGGQTVCPGSDGALCGQVVHPPDLADQRGGFL